MQDIKVYAAAILGIGTPGVSGFFQSMGPWLEALVRLGQVGVAVVTILYILRKWKNLRKSKKDDENDLT